MNKDSIWVQLVINVLGGLILIVVAWLFGRAFRRGILPKSLTPLRKAYSRFLFQRMSLICVAANVADGHWDKWAASYITDFLYRGKPYVPVFLPREHQEWAPFWEAVGSRGSTLTLVILGSVKRFEFTSYILHELERVAECPGRSLGLLEFPTKQPRESVIDYEDKAEVIVAREIKLIDPYKCSHKFPKVILIMGDSGPGTLAACQAYLANPRVFEPKRALLRGLGQQKMIGRVSVLTLSVCKKKAEERPGSYDYRFVKPDSIRLIRQRDFATGNIEEEVQMARLIRPLDRNIELPAKRDRPDDWHYYGPRKFFTALRNLTRYRDDVSDGDRREVRWGWKRDSDDGVWTRLVYLSAWLVFDGQDLICVDPYFHVYHRGEEEAIKVLAGKCKRIRSNSKIMFPIGFNTTERTLQLQIGRPRTDERELINRLMDRRPDPPQAKKLPEPVEVENLLKYTPCDLYVGSGLSYEVGIPQLRLLHMKFHVDDGESMFKFARDDGLIDGIEQDWEETFRGLLTVDIEYIRAKPGKSHKKIKELQDKGFVRRVYSDNVDDLLSRTGIEVISTRGKGLFNERVDVGGGADERKRLSSSREVPYLWVVGVSADRRDIIRQARLEKKTIVVINPDQPVSPRSKRLDYLEEGDLFIKMRFEEVRNLL